MKILSALNKYSPLSVIKTSLTLATFLSFYTNSCNALEIKNSLGQDADIQVFIQSKKSDNKIFYNQTERVAAGQTKKFPNLQSNEKTDMINYLKEGNKIYTNIIASSVGMPPIPLSQCEDAEVFVENWQILAFDSYVYFEILPSNVCK